MIPPAAPQVREYHLTLQIDVPTGRFSGKVGLELDGIDGPFGVNAYALDIPAARFNGRPVALQARPKDEEVWVTGADGHRGRLEMEFAGQATDRGLMGLYRCSYGATSILTTQCQPTGARRLFPCIDRPDRKAAFHLDLTTDSGVDVIYNMPAATEVVTNGQTRRTFAPTPPMATYLFYLGLGGFDWRRTHHGERVALGVAAPPGRGEAGAYALEKSQTLLAEFERYFGIDYPLPKLDLVTVPEHAFGAMENWGAISFREMRLLVDERTSDRQRRDTLSTIAHEIAHQWFGNLVTLESWTDVWLNESFATLMEMVMVERLEPTSGIVPDFLLLWNSAARIRDSLASTHPVIVPVESADEIGQAFDEISYGKGASVLRMFEGFLGEPTFRAGVTDYLNRFRFANARSTDLWDAFDRASGQPMHAMLDAWLCRPGLPLVRVTTSGSGVELSQERFSLTGTHAPGIWPIPLAYRSGGERHTRRWETERLRLESVDRLHLNPDARGFYRVLYDAPLYESLLGRFSSLSELDRWGVLEDLFAFTLSGDLPPERFLEFAASQRSSSAYLVVQELTGELGSLANLAGPTGRFVDAARDFLQAQWARLGPDPRPGEPDGDAILRERVADVLVFHDEPIAKSLAARFDDFEALSGNLRGPVAAAFGRLGGREAHGRLRARLQGERREGVAFHLEYALVSSKDPALVHETLELTRGSELNRAHTAQIVRRAGLNPQGRTATWAWIRAHLGAFADEYPGTDLAGYICQHALPVVGIGRRSEVVEHLGTHPIPSANRGAAKGLALLEVTDRFARRYGPAGPDGHG
ncbi:MAG: M1 family metallopeptidase [Thermoplasmata archaeon]|nr:M1 family metallopeptidase [Thermoplasmata archaeon]